MDATTPKFKRKHSNGEKLVAAYWVLGYPSVKESMSIFRTLNEAGADIIEIGYPYSDPVADGETIQDAIQKALTEGVHLDQLWKVSSTIANYSDPFVMTYGNIPFQFGLEAFVEKAKQSGIAGAIFPDLLPEVYPNVLKGIPPAFLISPNTSLERAEFIAQQSQSFIYLITRLGTTGGRNFQDKRLEKLIHSIKSKRNDIPLMVGFGISSQSQAIQAFEQGADGIIVGSELIKKYQTGGKSQVLEFVSELKEVAAQFSGNS